MKILFYDARDYDRDSFDAQLKNYPNIKIDYIEADLSPVTASLARGYDAVCAFVNSDASAMALEILRVFDVKLVLMRSAGFDAVNVPVAKDLGMTVLRVPAYSPEAIAEQAIGLGLCAARRSHKGYLRVRENDFSLQGLLGVNLHLSFYCYRETGLLPVLYVKEKLLFRICKIPGTYRWYPRCNTS